MQQLLTNCTGVAIAAVLCQVHMCGSFAVMLCAAVHTSLLTACCVRCALPEPCCVCCALLEPCCVCCALPVPCCACCDLPDHAVHAVSSQRHAVYAMLQLHSLCSVTCQPTFCMLCPASSMLPQYCFQRTETHRSTETCKGLQ